MRYSLTNYVGSGSVADPFRPAGSDSFAEWSAIDLRPDPTAVAGWGFLATPTPPTASALIFSLGDDLTDLSLANRLLLQSKLGIILEAGRTLRRHIRDILTVHARTDGTRWKPLLPEWINGTRARAWRVRLGGEVIDELPVVEGGSTISESFNKANSDTLGPDLTWTEVAGDFDIVGNKAQLQAGSILRCAARAETALATADHFAQVDCDPAGASGDIGDLGVAVRFAAAANTYYELGRNPSTDTRRIVKFVAGAGTLVASGAYADDDANHTVYGSVSGSSLRLLVDGANELTATDTAITANVRVGLSAIRNAAPNAVTVDFDNFTAADLGVTVAGNQATETDTANAGTPLVALPGGLATETDTPNAGTPAVTVAGNLATEADTPLAGAPHVTWPGALAAETVTANPGSILVTVAGSQAVETDTALAGSAVGGAVAVIGDRRGCQPAAPTSRRGNAPAAPTSRRGNQPAPPTSRRA